MSDPHKDVDVEDHIRTMMANTGRSKRNAARLDEIEPKQDDERERLLVVERVLKAVEELPLRVAELTVAANAVVDLPAGMADLKAAVIGRDKARNIIVGIVGLVLVALSLIVSIWGVTR